MGRSFKQKVHYYCTVLEQIATFVQYRLLWRRPTGVHFVYTLESANAYVIHLCVYVCLSAGRAEAEAGARRGKIGGGELGERGTGILCYRTVGGGLVDHYGCGFWSRSVDFVPCTLNTANNNNKGRWGVGGDIAAHLIRTDHRQ